MTLTPTALVLLNVQRHELEGHPQERELARDWAHRVESAREHRDLIVLVQWDGAPDTPGETFGKGWTLHPDFRAEAGDLLVRAVRPDPFRSADLGALLHGRAVRDVFLLGLEGTPELEVTARAAQEAGFGVVLLPTPVDA
ncbi:isochorismatase family protein [Deinococcus koreensis]|uniref:isochorismatase family protein n=1 Tax=Deinococcus koreensis TaxID=2054903 RepID=UPI000DDA3618|nr:isochorismatase family protein [Deinococcus koreensis]